MSELRIFVDGEWTAREFSFFFSDIATIVSRGNDFFAELVNQEHGFIFHEAPKVKRVSFSSPGEIDFIGLGKAATAIKELIVELVTLALEAADRKQSRQLRRLEMQAVALDVQSKFLRNLAELAELQKQGVLENHQLERVGEEFQRAMASIASAVDDGRITGAK